MNRKGQEALNGIGIFVSIFVVVIVGLALFTASAQNVGITTNQIDSVNITVTAGAADTAVDIVGQEIFGTPVVMNNTVGNNTGNETANSSVFTFSEEISNSTGQKTISMLTNDFGDWNGEQVSITYTYGADGYIDDAGARSVALLIVIFFAVAIMAISLIPALRSKVLEQMGR